MVIEQIHNLDDLPRNVAAKAVRRLRAALRSPDTEPALAPRETEIARLVEQGLSNREIGERMRITKGTVVCRLGTIYLKFGLKTRHELAFCARGGVFIRRGRIVGGQKRPMRLVSLPLE